MTSRLQLFRQTGSLQPTNDGRYTKKNCKDIKLEFEIFGRIFFLPKSAEFCPAAFCSLVSLDRIVCLSETSLSPSSLLLSLTSSLLVMLLMQTNCSKHHLCQKWTDPFWISLKPKLIAIKQRLISLSR